MSEFNFSFVHAFGPLVQLFFKFGLLLVVAVPLGRFAFWIERKLLGTNKRWLGAFPIIATIICMLYGVLRFWGLLIYPSDGWDTTGFWNYTNQNQGVFIIFICGCLLTGMVLALCGEIRKKRAA